MRWLWTVLVLFVPAVAFNVWAHMMQANRTRKMERTIERTHDLLVKLVERDDVVRKTVLDLVIGEPR
jgi:cell division protein FtsB